MKVYRYVITSDRGSAPNYDEPAATLAICKPKIRLLAQPGDLIIAFTGASISSEPHAGCWAGIVSEKLTFEQYWDDARFEKKKPEHCQTPDNIYKPVAGILTQVPNSSHQDKHIQRDLSGEFVLVINPVWRFGASGPILPAEFGLRITGGRRAHRVREISDADWGRLSIWLAEQSKIESSPFDDAKAGYSRGCS